MTLIFHTKKITMEGFPAGDLFWNDIHMAILMILDRRDSIPMKHLPTGFVRCTAPALRHALVRELRCATSVWRCPMTVMRMLFTI